MTHSHFLRSLFLAALVVLVGFPGGLRASSVLVTRVEGPIQEIQVEILRDAVAQAEEADAALLVVELDTPGGLVTSMREMVQAILGSKVPVACLVGPAGAHAASAGFFLLMSGDVAAMTEGSNTGAAHPVMAIGGLVPVKPEDMDPSMMEKATNDATAFLRGYTAKRGRDPDEAVRAIEENRTWTAAEALDAELIDLVVDSAEDLVERLHGRVITRMDGEALVLDLEGATIRRLEATPRQTALLYLSNPMLALLLALAGLALLYLEFTHPGMIAPGVIGALAVVLSLVGFSFLPIDYVGVLLILGGIGLLVTEVLVPGFGVFGIAGAVALSVGAVILVKAPIPEMRIPVGSVLALTLPFSALILVLGRLVVRAQRRVVVTGQEGMVGVRGTVSRAILAPGAEGMVYVHGELWAARSETGEPIGEGAEIEVVAVDGLRLTVRSLQSGGGGSDDAPRVESVEDSPE